MSRFFFAEVTETGDMKGVLEAAGTQVNDGDIVCYNVLKKEDVSGKKYVAVTKGKNVTEGDAARKTVGLPPSGGKPGSIKVADIPTGSTCYVQSTSHNRKVPKGSHVLLVRAGSNGPGKRKAPTDGEPVANKRPAASVGEPVASKRPAASSREAGVAGGPIAALLEQFKRFGEVGKPASASSVPENVPPEIRDMLLLASEWHIQKNSYGVFGLNFFDKGNFLNKVQIMGDADLVEDWSKEHKKPNCGEDGWECIAAVSEFDYIFVNVDPSSKHFGATRKIVNNCDDDDPLTPAPFSNFLKKVDAFAKKFVKHRESAGEDWEDESPMFGN